MVNDDMPFLVDSVTMEINRQSLTLHLLIHPMFAVERNADGSVRSVKPGGAAGAAGDAPYEWWMHVEVDRVIDPKPRAQVVSDIERVLGDVRAACSDWRPMLARLRAAIAELDLAAARLAPDERLEAHDFLQWLAEDHFTLLGYCQHDLVSEGGTDALRRVAGSGLGLLRERAGEATSVSFAAFPNAARPPARAAL